MSENGSTYYHPLFRLAAAFNISRLDQDEYALRSHTLAHEATEKGNLVDLLSITIPGGCVHVGVWDVMAPPPVGKEKVVSRDNGVKVASKEKLAKLNPAFIRPHGTITPANASFLVSDGGGFTWRAWTALS